MSWGFLEELFSYFEQSLLMLSYINEIDYCGKDGRIGDGVVLLTSCFHYDPLFNTYSNDPLLTLIP